MAKEIVKIKVEPSLYEQYRLACGRAHVRTGEWLEDLLKRGIVELQTIQESDPTEA